MKSFLCAAVLIFASLSALAAAPSGPRPAAGRGYACEARGQMDMGAPGGGIWTSVYGYGQNQNEAMMNALSACQSRGLRNCTPGLCNQRVMGDDAMGGAAAEMAAAAGPPNRGWYCDGYGVQNTGGPGGGVSVPTRGYGATQQDAFSNTIERCYQMGLRQCGVSSCGRQ